MITTEASPSTRRSAPEAHASPATLWDLDAVTLHDRAWAARGVQVVRRGSRRGSVPSQDALYLLLEPTALVHFEPPPVSRRLPSRRALLRVRMVEAGDEAYSERVTSDDGGRLVALRRQYAPSPRAELQTIITRDSEVAALWQRADARRAAWRNVRVASGIGHQQRVTCWGRAFRADDPQSVVRYTQLLARSWSRPGDAIPGLREARPGVWAHESATIGRGVRFVPPVWIGAHATIGADDVVAGPWIFPDASRLPARATAAPPLVETFARSRTAPAPVQIATPRPGKRAFDLVFSVFALLLTAPMWPIIVLAIWIEDGRPFLFRQTRQTIGGRNFCLWKFRTMCRDAERMKARLHAKNLCDGPQFHMHDDPRLLRVGRVMRKLHLDELPQFLNVLRGDMHVVGPRPSPDAENQYCPTWREARLSVKPGVTGLWQVRRTRAPNTDFQEWIRYDLEYVARQDSRLDAWILWRTISIIIASALRTLRRRPPAPTPAIETRRSTTPTSRDRLRRLVTFARFEPPTTGSASFFTSLTPRSPDPPSWV